MTYKYITTLKAPARYCTNGQKMEAMLTSGRQAGYKLGTTRNRSDPGLCPKHSNNSYKPTSACSAQG